MNAPLPEHPGKLLESRGRLSDSHDPAGIAVKPVADGWTEGGKVFRTDSSGCQEVADRVFIERHIIRLRFLGQHAGRLVDQKDLFILVDDFKRRDRPGSRA